MLSRLNSLWRNLRHRGAVDRDLDEEVRAVFDLLVAEKVAAGLTPEAARRAARLELGHEAAITQQVREERAGAGLELFVSDLRYAARTLTANPGFTLVVVLSIAIGIGANTAMFSVANALLLRTMAVKDPGSLYLARVDTRQQGDPLFSYPYFAELRDALPAPAGIAAMSRVMRVQTQAGGGAPLAATIQMVSGEFFEVLGIPAVAGRVLGRDDNVTVGAHPVMVISDAFRRRRFPDGRDAVGQELTVNGWRFTVAGVAQPGFTGVWLESPVDAWLPVAMQAEVRYIGNFSAANANLQMPWMPQDAIRWLELVVRAGRADGAELAALNGVHRGTLLREADQTSDPEERRRILDERLSLAPFGTGASTLRQRFRTPLFALMATVAVLLLITCVNTANLLLARAAARQREMAVRLSLGATRGRVIRQLLTESLLLSALAAAAGLLVAPFASDILVRMAMGVESGPLPFSVPLDPRVLTFTLAITLVTGVLFGLVPALRATDLSLSATLKAHGRGTHGGARLNLAKTLVIAQVALSLLLVAGAGLFLRSLGNLSSTPLGFDTASIVSATVNVRGAGYAPEALPALYQRMLDRATALPGVEAAAFSMCGLMTACRSTVQDLVVTGYVAGPGERGMAHEQRVTRGYLRTLGVPLVAGRDFTEQDQDGRVAIINEAMARRYFKDRDPVGQRFGRDAADTEIIGVAADARFNSAREAAEPTAFFLVDPTTYPSVIQVRTSGDAAAMTTTLRRALQELEPGLAIDRVSTARGLVANSFRLETLVARLTTALGAIALGVACLGLYGLRAYAVRRRTGEIGLRFALGAPRGRVLWMVLSESLALAAAGVVAGLPAVLLITRFAGGFLFEVSPDDPVTIAGAAVILLMVALAASYLPAWRASRIDPLTALRQE